MLVNEFDYELPESAIAQTPAVPRDAARLLVDAAVIDQPGEWIDAKVTDLASFFRPGDAVVLNNTRVLPARVLVTRPTGGSGEVLFLAPLTEVQGNAQTWEALARPNRKLREGMELSPIGRRTFTAGDPRHAEPQGEAEHGRARLVVGADLGDGRREIRVVLDESEELSPDRFHDRLVEMLEDVGEMPLPPYLHEGIGEAERYQTVYSKRAASAAAPTAGLHLTRELLHAFSDAGVVVVEVELVVGLGTFRPMSTERVEDHRMHRESYSISPESWGAIAGAKRVIAVGTTSARALEAAAHSGELSGSTDIFIRRPFDWRVVDVLMTNFHLPKSSLLVLVDAFVGPTWREVYRHGLEAGYRFLSFGDAMLIARQPEFVPEPQRPA